MIFICNLFFKINYYRTLFIPLAIGPQQLILISIIFLLVFFISIYPTWLIYEKAGEPSWAAIIPIYSTLVWLKIIGKPWYWILLLCIPYVNVVFYIWATNLTSKSYGKEEGFTVGLVLLPFVFYPILGYGSSQYIGQAGNQQQRDLSA